MLSIWNWGRKKDHRTGEALVNTLSCLSSKKRSGVVYNDDSSVHVITGKDFFVVTERKSRDNLVGPCVIAELGGAFNGEVKGRYLLLSVLHHRV